MDPIVDAYPSSRSSPGNPPSLYDTSTSTADSSYGSIQERRRNNQPSNKKSDSRSKNRNMYPSYYFPDGSQQQQQQQQPMSSGSPRSGGGGKGLRSTMSEPGVSTEYERYRNERYSSSPSIQHHHIPAAPASDVGAMSVSEQIRQYNRRNHSDAVGLNTVSSTNSIEDYSYQQQQQQQQQTEQGQPYYHTTTMSSSSSSSLQNQVLKDDPVLRARETYLQASPSRSTTSGQGGNMNGGEHSRRRLPPQVPQHHITSSSPSLPVPASRDPNDSFGSVETPSLSSVKALKKRLWNEGEVLQVRSSHHGEAEDVRRHRPSRSLSPARHQQPQPQPPGNRSRSRAPQPTDDADSSTKFNSKYYTAALAANHRPPTQYERHQQEGEENEDEEARRTVSPRHRMNSRETQASAYSTPYDEGGRDNRLLGSSPSPHSSGNRGQSPSLEATPPLQSSSYEDRNRLSPLSVAVPPQRSAQDSRPLRYRHKSVESSSPKTSVAAEPRGRDPGPRRREPSAERRRSSSREARRRSSLRGGSRDSRGRTPSPLIQQRIHEYSQEARGRTLTNDSHMTTTTTSSSRRSVSQKPRIRKNSESSFERLAREFSGEIHSMGQEVAAAKSSPVHKPLSRGVSRDLPSVPTPQPHGLNMSNSESSSSNRDASRTKPTNSRGQVMKSASMDNPMPSNRWPAKDCSGEKVARTQQYSEMAAFLQGIARASPTYPMAHPPMTNRSAVFGNEKTMSWDKGASLPVASTAKQAVPSLEPKRPGEKRNVDKLVAKLSAVNRANPAAALAQIDSILRHESRSNSGGPENRSRGVVGDGGTRDAPNLFEDTMTNVDEDDDDSDDETSVSSMTNPSYQSCKPHHEQVKVQESKDASALEAAGRPPSPSGALSTSSFRRPRPSGLQSYIPANLQPEPSKQLHKEGTTMSKAKERRAQLKKFPPPATIKVKDASLPPSPEPNVENMHFKVTITPQNSSPSQVPPQVQKSSKAVAPKKLDKFISDKEALAAKIRVWDDMSHGLTKSTSDMDDGEEKKLDRDHIMETTRNLPALANTDSRRPHPWDGEVPARIEKVDVRETSMDNAAGVETSMAMRNAINSNLLDVAQQRSPDVSFTDERQIVAHTQAPALPARSTPTRRGPPAEPEDFLHEQADRGPAPVFTPHDDGGGWGVTPRLTPEQHENAQKISADFDEAWVSMPRGGFYPEAHQEEDSYAKHHQLSNRRPDPPPAQQNPWLARRSQDSQGDPRRGCGPIDLDESVDTSGSSQQGAHRQMPPVWKDDRLLEDSEDAEHGAIEVSLLSEDMLDTSGEASEVPSLGPLNNVEAKPRRRGFLRAFMRKEKKRHHTPPATSVHESSHSISQGSSGANSMPVAGTRPIPQIRMMPLPPGVNFQEMPPPPSRGRIRFQNGRDKNERSRSASLERFRRSSSMAQKFGRVMKLYDQD